VERDDDPVQQGPTAAEFRWGLVLKEDVARERDTVAGARGPLAGSDRGARGPLIGSAGFYDWSAKVRSAECGYDLRPEYRGRGLMAEALAAILDFAFTEEGTLREHDLDERGALCDDVVFSLLAREWRRPGS